MRKSSSFSRRRGQVLSISLGSQEPVGGATAAEEGGSPFLVRTGGPRRLETEQRHVGAGLRFPHGLRREVGGGNYDEGSGSNSRARCP